MGITNYNDCNCRDSGSTYPYLKPSNLKCPPDLSTLLFRFIEKRKVGVVQGKTEITGLDMSSFFLPLDNYTMLTMTLCPNEIKKVDPTNISTTGKRREIVEFDISSSSLFSTGYTAQLVILEGSTTLATITGIDASTSNALIDDLKDKILGNTAANNAIEFYEYSHPKFQLRGKESGKSYTYTLTFFNSFSNPLTTLNPIIIQTSQRYPNADVLRLIFATIEFCNDCGSNKQYIEYAYDDDYDMHGLNATWRKVSKLLVLTGANDIQETDTNLIETLWLRNPGNCKVKIHLILGI